MKGPGYDTASVGSGLALRPEGRTTIPTGPTLRILVATKPVDFRNGMDGLAATCRQQLEQDPMTGCAFVFCHCQGTAIKWPPSSR
jgi:transposase